MVSIRKFLQGLGLVSVSSTAIDTKGELEVLTTGGYLNYHNGTTASHVVTAAHTETLTNKSMDGSANTFTNLPTSALSGSVNLATQVTGTLPVGNGGLGVATLTSNGVVIGNSTSGVTVTAEGATGTVLHGNTGADPSFSAVSLTADVTGVLPLINGGTGTAAASANAAFNALSPMTTGGDLIYGGASGAATRLGNGTAGQVLQSNGTTLAPSWAAAAVASPLTTKGDIYGFSTVNARLPVGTNGQHLSADSTQTLGIKWIDSSRTINAQTGTTYTFVLADGSGTDGDPLVTATNASAQTYTVPTNASVAFPTGTQIDVTQLGAGLVTFAAAGGVTINSLSGGLAMLGRYSAATLIKTGTDTWELYGTGTSSSPIVQQVRTQTGAVATGSTQIPLDDTIPQNTEGDQYLSLAITPTNASSKLMIEVSFTGANSGNGQLSMALFQDSTANALAATSFGILADSMVTFPLIHSMAAGTTSATTFKVRVGLNGSGTTTINGRSGARQLGGVMASSITITEYTS